VPPPPHGGARQLPSRPPGGRPPPPTIGWVRDGSFVGEAHSTRTNPVANFERAGGGGEGTQLIPKTQRGCGCRNSQIQQHTNLPRSDKRILRYHTKTTMGSFQNCRCAPFFCRVINLFGNSNISSLQVPFAQIEGRRRPPTAIAVTAARRPRPYALRRTPHLRLRADVLRPGLFSRARTPHPPPQRRGQSRPAAGWHPAVSTLGDSPGF